MSGLKRVGSNQALAPNPKDSTPQKPLLPLGSSTPLKFGAPSAAIKITPNKDAKQPKEVKLSSSCPNIRFIPPKAPTQRPRVPSLDPPPMALPPSPAVEIPIQLLQPAPAANNNNNNAPAQVSDSKQVEPAGALPVPGANPPKRRASFSRSLAIYSSSAPQTSYLLSNSFVPSFAPLAEVNEKQPVGLSSSSSLNSSSANSPSPVTPNNPLVPPSSMASPSGLAKEDELLAAVGSPTIFSMLRVETEQRRRSSLALDESKAKEMAAAVAAHNASLAANPSSHVSPPSPSSSKKASKKKNSIQEEETDELQFKLSLEDEPEGSGSGEGSFEPLF